MPQNTLISSVYKYTALHASVATQCKSLCDELLELVKKLQFPPGKAAITQADGEKNIILSLTPPVLWKSGQALALSSTRTCATLLSEQGTAEPNCFKSKVWFKLLKAASQSFSIQSRKSSSIHTKDKDTKDDCSSYPLPRLELLSP